MEGFFYKSKKSTSFLSKDNKGKVVEMVMTFSKKFDPITNNADLLKFACAVVKQLMVANDRVTDAWGGLCGKKSATLPAASAAATTTTTTTAAANTTKAKTRVLAANTTTTAAAPTTYKAKLYL